MLIHSPSTFPASNLATAPSRCSMGEMPVELLHQLAERGRQQTVFYNVRLTPAEFRNTGDYAACRDELFKLFFRLKSRLPATGEGADVAHAVERQASAWSAPGDPITESQALMFGAGKRLMVELCQALETDPRPSTQAAACRALRAAFQDSRCREDAVTAIGRAVSVVLEECAPALALLRRNQASAALTAWADDNEATDWTSRDVATGLLEYLGYDEAPDVEPDTAFQPSSLGARAVNAAHFRCVLAADPEARGRLSPPPYTAPIM
ncbi:MAG: hypothetical protein EOP37_21305 [Rubrivivax sp.]|nr:MAG: hypothetical protein EOP37_21305 [Rubrivivax sp.]